jgi:hypothetical protein
LEFEAKRLCGEAGIRGADEGEFASGEWELASRQGEFSVGLYLLLESKRQQLEGSLGGEYLRPRIHTPFTRALK